MINRMNKIFSNERGLTLVEVLIASAIFMIVLILGYSLYFFTVRNFGTGAAQAEAQQEAKVAHEHFKSELRNSRKLSTNSPNGNDWGFFELEGELLKKSRNSETIDISDNIEYIKFEVIEKEDERFVLEYEIKSVVDEQEHTFSNQLLLNNIDDQQKQIDGIDIGEEFEMNGEKLYYSDTPDD